MRDFTVSDLAVQDAYFRNATDEYLMRMGVHPPTIRGAITDAEAFRKRIELPVRERPAQSFIFELDGVIVGNFTLKPISFGETSGAHGHIYVPELRRSSLGTQAMITALDESFKRFELKMIYCEPSVGNPAPNALLQGVGLKVVATYKTPAEGVLMERTANRYEITRDWFHRELRPRFL